MAQIRLPTRYRWPCGASVGKQMGPRIYFFLHPDPRHPEHPRHLHDWLADLQPAIGPAFGDRYNVIRVQLERPYSASGNLLLSSCPNFASEPEPIIARQLAIEWDCEGVRTFSYPPAEDPLIYHHKWLFVPIHHAGFDVVAARRRSIEWLNLRPPVDKRKIGRWSYWQAHVLPRLQGAG